MLHPCVEDRKNFSAFYGDPVRTCLDFRQNGFEFRTSKAKCLISRNIVGVFSGR
jgi:hypothetical protein